MSYPTYLVHFNKNHSSKDGKFTYGDGDGDGIADDHNHGKSNRVRSSNNSDAPIRTTPTERQLAKSAKKHGKNMTTLERDALGRQQIKKGIGMVAGGAVSGMVAKTLYASGLEEAGLAFYGLAAGLTISGIVKGVKGASNMFEASGEHKRKQYAEE